VGVSKPRRTLIFAAVMALHVAAIAVLITAARERKPLATEEVVVSTLIYLQNTSSRLAPSLRHTPPGVSATVPSLTEPTPEVLQQSNDAVQKQELIDWTAAAHQAARELLAAEAAERVRNSKMGTGWWLDQDAKQRRRTTTPAFPWSHQPQTSWMEIDPDSLVITFRSERCQLSIFLVVAGFGCALGHIDPAPGRADLFDPKYHSTPLELPAAIGEDADH
jgi:hypothetical protein